MIDDLSLTILCLFFFWKGSNCVVLLFLSLPDIRHPEELSLLRKPRDPKKKKKKLEEAEEDDLELEGPLLTPGSGESAQSHHSH